MNNANVANELLTLPTDPMNLSIDLEGEGNFAKGLFWGILLSIVPWSLFLALVFGVIL